MSALLIALLLTFGPLVGRSIEIAGRETGLRRAGVGTKVRIEFGYSERDISIKRDQPLRGRVDSPNDSLEKVVLEFDGESGRQRTTPQSREEPDYSQSRYKSLAIVCSISALIVLTIGLTVLYIQYKRGNNSTQPYMNGDGLQLNTISNNVNLDLDLMSGTHYLNRGVMAFNDITDEIIAHQRNSNGESTPVNKGRQISSLLVI